MRLGMGCGPGSGGMNGLFPRDWPCYGSGSVVCEGGWELGWEVGVFKSRFQPLFKASVQGCLCDHFLSKSVKKGGGGFTRGPSSPKGKALQLWFLVPHG